MSHDEPVRLNTKLNRSIAEDIKAMVWNGVNQESVAQHFGLSQTHVSRIVRGKSWYDARWPDGSVGAIPTGRIAERLARGVEQIPIASQSPVHTPPRPHSPAPTVEEAERQILADREAKASQQQLIDRFGDAAEAGLNAELEAALIPSSKARPARETVIDEPQDIPDLSWDEIAATIPKSLIVRLGETRPELRPAICKALSALSHTEWTTRRAIHLTETVAKVMNIKLEIKDDERNDMPEL